MEDTLIIKKSELFSFLDARPAINMKQFAKAGGLPQSILARRKTSRRDTNLILKKSVLELYGWK